MTSSAERQLQTFVNQGHWQAPKFAALRAALEALDTTMLRLSGSPGWTGQAADAAGEAWQRLRKRSQELADAVAEMERIIAAANATRDEAQARLHSLPAAGVPSWVHQTVHAAEAGSKVFLPAYGISVLADEAVDIVDGLLSSHRADAAAEALRQLNGELTAEAARLTSLALRLQPVGLTDPVDDTDGDTDGDGDGGGSGYGGGGGGYRYGGGGGGSSWQPSYGSGSGYSGGGSGGYQGGHTGYTSEFAADGSGVGVTSLSGRGTGGIGGSSGFGGVHGGGLNAAALGAATAGGAAALRAGMGGTAGGIAPSQVGVGQSGGLLGAGGAGAGAGARGGMMGAMPGGAAGAAEKKDRRASSGLMAPKLEDDEQEFTPLPDGARAGSRGGEPEASA